MATTANYNWTYPDENEDPWEDDIVSLITSIDGEMYKKTKDFFMQGFKIYGGDTTGANLNLRSTSHATKGKIYLGAADYYDEVNSRLQLTGIKIPTGAAVAKILTSDVNGVGTWQTPAGLPTIFPQLKFISPGVTKVAWLALTDWTDVDITSNVGADAAKAVLLLVEATLVATDAAGFDVVGSFRKKGSTATTQLPRLRAYASPVIDTTYTNTSTMIIVECSTLNIFQAKLEALSGGGTLTYVVDLIGYFI